MSDPTKALTIQFLAWIAAGPRSYAETMEAWRTSCPRLSIWEDAVRNGLVRLERSAGGGMKTRMVALTPAGERLLDAARAAPTALAAVMLDAVG